MDAYSVTDYNWHNGEVIETGDEKVRVLHAPVRVRDSDGRLLLYTEHGHVIAEDLFKINAANPGTFDLVEGEQCQP